MSHDTAAPDGPGSPREGGAAPASTPGARPPVTVRLARIEDLAAIVDLLTADEPRRGEVDLAPYAAAFARMTAASGHLQAVAELDGQVVGTLQLSIVPGLALRGVTRGQIDGVRTLSSLRGRGIGDALFEWAISTARDRGVHMLQVHAESSLANVHRFYENLGFAATHAGFTMQLAAAARGGAR